MKDIRCIFGCHTYSQAEAKVVNERKGYLITRVNMCCLRCEKSYEDIIVIPFPEWLQQKELVTNDLISRQKAIDALWKALYEYEDKMEKQFIESDDLDIKEWIQHRIFVQDMSDIDRKTILDLPCERPENREARDDN